jgi:hypothetical protein
MSYCTTGQTKNNNNPFRLYPEIRKKKKKTDESRERKRERGIIVQAGPQREGTEEKKIKSRGQDGRVRMTR